MRHPGEMSAEKSMNMADVPVEARVSEEPLAARNVTTG